MIIGCAKRGRGRPAGVSGRPAFGVQLWEPISARGITGDADAYLCGKNPTFRPWVGATSDREWDGSGTIAVKREATTKTEEPSKKAARGKNAGSGAKRISKLKLLKNFSEEDRDEEGETCKSSNFKGAHKKGAVFFDPTTQPPDEGEEWGGEEDDNGGQSSSQQRNDDDDGDDGATQHVDEDSD